MHELGVVFHIIDDLRVVSEDNKIEKILSVTLQLGEVSTVIPEYLRNVWTWAVNRETFMKGCELVIETIPAQTVCEDCKRTYATVAHGRTCPYCGSERTYLIQGDEFIIKEIAAV